MTAAVTLHELLEKWIEGDPVLKGHIDICQVTRMGTRMQRPWMRIGCVPQSDHVGGLGLLFSYIARIEEDCLWMRDRRIVGHDILKLGAPDSLDVLRERLILHHNKVCKGYCDKTL